MPIIRTIKAFTETKIKEKNSVFIGQVYPVSSEEEAEAILTGIRKRYYDATHHCFCYKLQENKTRYSDDGEPSGTAGIKILSAIDHFNLVSVLLLVIRYYGGVKLGIGPLGKAYYDCAEGVLNKAEIVEKKAYNQVTFLTDFDNMNHVFRILSHHDVKGIETDYSDKVKIKCFVNSGVIQEISDNLTEITKGSIGIQNSTLVKFI